jgi:3-oxoacyl-[acyl-carrier-protein] synthase II
MTKPQAKRKDAMRRRQAGSAMSGPARVVSRQRRRPKVAAAEAGRGVLSPTKAPATPPKGASKPSAEGQASAIRHALRMTNLAAEEVDYINAHGTSTLLNDSTETQAIKLALGEHARRVPISSTKSVVGHAIGASGALEFIATVLAIRNQVLPPTVNLDEPDPACDLDYVPHKARKADVKTILKNSFGFGGQNACLVFKRFEE